MFATKPKLARAMIGRALDAGIPAAWVTGDEVYGADPGLRADLERRRIGYVLAVAATHQVTTVAGPCQARKIAARLPRRAWQRYSAGGASTAPKPATTSGKPASHEGHQACRDLRENPGGPGGGEGSAASRPAPPPAPTRGPAARGPILAGRQLLGGLLRLTADHPVKGCIGEPG